LSIGIIIKEAGGENNLKLTSFKLAQWRKFIYGRDRIKPRGGARIKPTVPQRKKGRFGKVKNLTHVETPRASYGSCPNLLFGTLENNTPSDTETEGRKKCIIKPRADNPQSC